MPQLGSLAMAVVGQLIIIILLVAIKTLIGVHLIMHLMHPNYGHATIALLID